jgi:hypothetical protein
MAFAAAIVLSGWLVAIARETAIDLTLSWKRALTTIANDARIATAYTLLVRPTLYLATVIALLVLWPHQTVTFIYFRF